jgi:hypothetical protein
MTSFRIRPRFELWVPESPDAVQARIHSRLNDVRDICNGTTIPGHIVLKIEAEEQHFWSPQLSLNLEAQDEGTLISGLYGPNPNVWLLFTFGYGTIGMLALFISIFGFSRMSLGMSAPILWALPVLGAAAVGLYLASQIGQKLGAEQTFTLNHFFEEAIGRRVHVH